MNNDGGVLLWRSAFCFFQILYRLSSVFGTTFAPAVTQSLTAVGTEGIPPHQDSNRIAKITRAV